MKLRHSFFVASLALLVPLEAANILLITRVESGSDDSGLTTLLTGAGHTVTNGGASAAGVPDTTGFDLVMISRVSSSGDYAGDAAEVQGWNEINVPLMIMNPYLYRSNRLGYVDGTEMINAGTFPTTFDSLDTGSDLVPGVSTNAYFDTDAVQVDYLNSLAVVTGINIVASATADGNQFIAIADVPAGTTLTTGNTTNTRHVLFTASDYPDLGTNAQLALSPNAEGILLNTVDVLAIPEPGVTSLAGLAGLLMLRRRRGRA